MLRTAALLFLAASAGIPGAATHAAEAATPPAGSEAELLACILSDAASLFDKAKACQQLAAAGTKNAVPVLSALLSDARLAHYARIGLEQIPDPSVDAAFRQALGTLKGPLLVGVLNSIGARRDARAVDSLTGLLGHADIEIAAAAAAALGRIGTAEAAGVLAKTLLGATNALKSAVAAACLRCAQRLQAEKRSAEAAALYDAVQQAELPAYLLLAARRGAILSRDAAGVPLLLEALAAADRQRFNLGLSVLRELPATQATTAVIERLGAFEDGRRAMVVRALGDRGDKAAIPALIGAAGSGPRTVRLAAIHALLLIGDASCVRVLLAAAAGEDEELAAAALDALAENQSPDLDQAFAAMHADVAQPQLAAWIEVIGRRRIAQAVSALMAAAEHEIPAIRRAAVRALGETIRTGDADALIALVLTATDAGDLDAATEALRAACLRATDPDAAAEKLVARMHGAPEAGQARILSVFSALGSARALAAAVSLTGAESAVLADAAYDTLGRWPSENAIAALLALARESDSGRSRRRALETFSALAARLGAPAERTLAWCMEALQNVHEDAERAPVLAALSLVAAPEALKAVTPYLEDPALAETAAAAAVAIAERLVRNQPQAVTRPMQQVIQVVQDAGVAARARRVLAQAAK